MAYVVNDYHDDQAELIVELWSHIETELIEEISRRVSETGITATGEFQLRLLEQANLLNRRAVELISEYSGISDEMVEDLIRELGFSVVERDEQIYRQAAEAGQLTFEPLPVDMSPTLETTMQGCIDNAEFGLSNLTNTRMIDAGNGMETLTKAARREYYDAVNKAFLDVRTGKSSTPDAVKSACQSLADKGIQITHWESGHKDSVDVAVRRNIRTAMAQTSGKMTLARMQDYQSDLVEVSAHMSARPSHYVWQGGIYSLSGSNGYENFYDATGYGTLLGLCGVNCRHRFFPYFPGTTPAFEQYDEEENKKAYDLTQQQRKLERDIRKAKRKVAAADGAGYDNKPAKAEVREKQKNMRDFLKEHPDMRRMYDREKIY